MRKIDILRDEARQVAEQLAKLPPLPRDAREVGSVRLFAERQLLSRRLARINKQIREMEE